MWWYHRAFSCAQLLNFHNSSKKWHRWHCLRFFYVFIHFFWFYSIIGWIIISMDKSICFWTWSYHVWPEGNVCGDIIARFRELSYWISIIVTVQRHMRVSLLPRGNISSLIPSISFSDGWMQKKSIKPQKNGHEIDSVSFYCHVLYLHRNSFVLLMF